jgi:RHS repeat-associated protein
MTIWMKRILCGLLAMVMGLMCPLSAYAQTVVYFHNDPAGSPIAATDASGNVLWRESYRPYGERMLKPAAANTQWFHGKSLDPDTGMEDFGARNYDPVLGRFLSIDPVDFTEKNIHSFNRYAYGNNNPLKYKDPDGRVAFLLPLVAALSEIGLATAVRLTATAAGRYLVSGATAVAAGEAGVALPGSAGAKSGEIAEQVVRTGQKGLDALHHNANVLVRDVSGKIREHTRLVSGYMTEQEKALGFPLGSLASHTEARAASNILLKEGEAMLITGQKRPCPSCRGKMNRAAEDSGGTITYQWRSDGTTKKWSTDD